MLRPFLLLPLLLLSACSREEPTAEAPKEQAKPAAKMPPAAPVPPKAAPAEARLVEEESDLFDFTYGWPAEAAAIPALTSRFEADMAKQRAEGLATAKEDKAGRSTDYPFNPHYFSKVWKTYGNGRRLLSLAAEVGTFTGGAHPNSGYEALLWDRTADRPIGIAQIFSDPGKAFELLGRSYCAKLDRERADRRDEKLPLQGEGWMVECPPIAEQVVVPLDRDDGIFESLMVLIGPYGAGPYAEGSYELELEVSDEVRRLIKPEYAGDF